MNRIQSLDYLRGIMAVSVMLYHYTSWSYGSIGADHVLGKLGIYAVSVFYILSGLSLTIAYHDKIRSRADVLPFAVKRAFRIFPLFWLSATATLAAEYASNLLQGHAYTFFPYRAFLNYSLLFGFIDPMLGIGTGTWSIGIEIVYYAIFPLSILLSTRTRGFLPVFLITCGVIAAYFASFLIDRSMLLDGQWNVYASPLNHLYLFMGGVAIGKYADKIKHLVPLPVALTALCLSLIAFAWYPSTGDLVHIVTGIERCVFSVLCLLVVMLIFLIDPKFGSMPAKALGFLGESCYSIYLLHPLVYLGIVSSLSLIGVSKHFGYWISFLMTLLVAWLTFKYLESPMMRIGRNLAGKTRTSSR